MAHDGKATEGGRSAALRESTKMRSLYADAVKLNDASVVLVPFFVV